MQDHSMKNGHDQPELRMASLDDVPWIVELGHKEMPGIVKDVPATELWLSEVIGARRAFVARSEHAFVIAHLSQLAFDPETKPLTFHTLCGDREYPESVWELLNLAHATLNWGKLNGATRAEMASSTYLDLGPLASRLGFTAITPRYSTDL